MESKHIKVKSIKTNYVYNLIYEIFAVIAPLITTPYISRVLGPEGVGVYSFTYSIAQYFIIFGNLGISIYGQMKIAEVRDDIHETSKTFYELLVLRCVTLLFSLLIYSFTVFAANEYKTARLILSVFIIASLFDFSWFFRGIENFSKVVLRDVLVKIIVIILIFLLVKKPADVNIYIALISASALIGNMTYIIALSRIIKPIQFGELKPGRHFKSCIIYFIPTIATSVYTILDKTMLGILTGGILENGYYEEAHKIEQILLVSITSYNAIMRSRMTYLYSKGDMHKMNEYMDKSIRFILFLSIAMCGGLIGISETFIPLFLGSEFSESVVLLRLFSVLLVFIGLSNCINTHFLGPSGRQNKNNIVLITGALLNFILNMIFIPAIGAVGAALASVIAELFILIGYLYLSRDFFKSVNIIIFGWKYIVASGIMTYVVHWINRIDINPIARLALQVGVGCCIYLVILLVLNDKVINEIIGKIRSISKEWLK